MTTPTGFKGLGIPPARSDHVLGYLRDVWTLTNNLLIGKLNATTTLTLTHDAATTTLSDPRIGGSTVILLAPRTANAAAALATTYYSAPAKGSAVFNHANNAQTDRVYDAILIG